MYEIGSVVDYCRQAIVAYVGDIYNGDTGSITFQLLTLNGYRSVHIIHVHTSHTDEEDICLLSLETSGRMCARSMVQSPLFNGYIEGAGPVNVPPLFSGAVAGAEYHINRINEVKNLMYTDWGFGLPGTPQVSTNPFNSIAAISTSMTMFADPLENVVVIERASYQDNPVVSPSVIDLTQTSSLPPDSVNAVGPDLAGVVAAIKDNQKMAYDVAFNHGQSVFSVRGQIITG